MLPPHPNWVAANAISNIAPNAIRRRRPAGTAVNVRPSSINPMDIGSAVVSVNAVGRTVISPAYLTGPLSIAVLPAITAFNEKVSEAPAASPIGAKTKTVVALGAALTLCPPPLRMSELKTAGSLTVMLTELTVCAALVVLVMVRVPAPTLAPGAAETATATVVAMAPGPAVGVAPGVGVGLLEVAVGAGVEVGVGAADVN